MKKRMQGILCFLLFCGVVQAFLLYGISTQQLVETVGQSMDGQNIYEQVLGYERGMIYDENKEPLRGEEKQYFTIIEPQYFNEENPLPLVIENLIESWGEKQAKGRPFAIITSVPYQMAGITSFVTSKRATSTSPALHTLGYTSGEENRGMMGLERVFEEELKSNKKTLLQYVGDGAGGSISGLGIAVLDEEQQEGGIQTTLNKEIQQVVDGVASQYLEAGAIVVLEIKTGEIKGIASRPLFDPEHIEKYLESTKGEFLNRVFLEYPLGSVFKTVLVGAALQQGIKPSSTYYECTGKIDLDGYHIHCLKEEGHGLLNMEEAFACSCNSYFIQLAWDLQKNGGFFSLAQELGFGKEINLGENLVVPGGCLPQKESLGDLANGALGQGEFLTTPLQAARLMATIARGGIDIAPSLLCGVVDEQGEIITSFAPQEKRVVLDAEVAKQIAYLLRGAVLYGTGKNADAIAVGGTAGKTGSAEAEGGQVHGWFCGFVPYDNPQYAIAVFAEDGKMGSVSCGPAFLEIAEEIVQENPLA